MKINKTIKEIKKEKESVLYYSHYKCRFKIQYNSYLYDICNKWRINMKFTH